MFKKSKYLGKAFLGLMTSSTLLLASCSNIPLMDKGKSQPNNKNENAQQVPTDEANHQQKPDDTTEKWAIKKSQLNQIQVTNGIKYIQNPNNIAVLVNKEFSLPVNYRAKDLIKPDVKFSFDEKNEKQLMRKEAAEALHNMFESAKKEGVEITAVSGFRSYQRQKQVFTAEVAASGAEHAQQAVAEPGKSEHQTGLTMDISSAENQFQLNEDFEKTAAGKWLAKNSAEYGFILRYPKGKEKATGYMFEPWHFRYVGVDIAKDINKRGLTLEEYVQLARESYEKENN